MNEQHFFSLPLDQREAYFFQHHPTAQLLKNVLLGIGGTRIIWMGIEPHLTQLIKDGARFPLNQMRMVKGDHNRCHANTARLFLDKGIEIATGYGLSEDGYWRAHSWGVLEGGKRIVETTLPRIAYYGAILKELDITKFILGELGDEMMGLNEEQLKRLPMPKITNQKRENVITS